MYRIREVDGHDDEIADTLTELHRLTFFDSASIPKFEQGHWWLAFYKANAVDFAAIVASTYAHNAGFLPRRRAQTALRSRPSTAPDASAESRARQIGWGAVVSDTTDNIASANNFLRAGYRLYQPPCPWAWAEHAVLVQIRQVTRCVFRQV